MSEASRDMLCTALDIVGQAADNYRKALGDCGTALGSEVLRLIYEAKLREIDRMKSIHDKLAGGGDWASACGEEAVDLKDGKALFKSVLAGHLSEKSCPSTDIEAIQRAVDIELSILRIFEARLGEIADPVEKRFVERMIQEVKGHYVALNEMMYYFEEPEGWQTAHGTLNPAS